MTQSTALKWLLVVLLPLTIAWKVAINPENPAEIQGALVQFLREHGFAIGASEDRMEYMDIVHATSASCDLRVARISPLGHEADLVRKVTAGKDHTFYVFRGEVYHDQPVRLTVMNYLAYRFLRELGLVRRVPPVLAVMSSCNAERLPWMTLPGQQPL